MKYVLLLLLPGGCLLALLIGLARWQRNRQVVSAAWLAEQDRKADTAGMDGVVWKWPVNKIVNDHGRFNRERLRQRA